MASGVWKIVELRRGAQGGSEGASFQWSASTVAITENGGGRAAPKMGWSFGGEQRHVRTDYPGATMPSVQVLGPKDKPFTLEGRFDDRYNFRGYAVEEQRRLEEMLKRGNLCRVSFQDQVFIGLFTEWDFPYRRDWQIDYTLTFDVHSHANGNIYGLDPREEVYIIERPGVAFDQTDLAAQALLEYSKLAPRSLLAGSTVEDADAVVAGVASSVDQLALTLDNRDISPPENPVDGFTRMATQFRQVQGAAYGVLLQLGAVRSDAQLSVQTALGVLDFEVWSRSLRFAARVAMGRAVVGDRACRARAEPDAVRLYRPQAGESLYAIARRFLGTPHAWRLIYDRNHLSSITLTGDEILVIPERGA